MPPPIPLTGKATLGCPGDGPLSARAPRDESFQRPQKAGTFAGGQRYQHGLVNLVGGRQRLFQQAEPSWGQPDGICSMYFLVRRHCRRPIRTSFETRGPVLDRSMPVVAMMAV